MYERKLKLQYNGDVYLERSDVRYRKRKLEKVPDIDTKGIKHMHFSWRNSVLWFHIRIAWW